MVSQIKLHVSLQLIRSRRKKVRKQAPVASTSLMNKQFRGCWRGSASPLRTIQDLIFRKEVRLLKRMRFWALFRRTWRIKWRIRNLRLRRVKMKILIISETFSKSASSISTIKKKSSKTSTLISWILIKYTMTSR